MRLEADRQAFGAAGESAELVEGALVRRDFRRQAVVLVTDVVVERPRLLVVHQFRERVEGHRLADARLGGGVVDQRLGLLAGLLLGHVLAFHEIAEGLEQGARFARRIDPFLAADEVAEIVGDLLPALALDERDVLLRLLVVAPFGNVDPRGQVQLAEVQVARRGDLQRLVHRHAFAVVQQGDRQVVGHALLVVGEQDVAAGGEMDSSISFCRCSTASRLKPTKSRSPSRYSPSQPLNG